MNGEPNLEPVRNRATHYVSFGRFGVNCRVDSAGKKLLAVGSGPFHADGEVIVEKTPNGPSALGGKFPAQGNSGYEVKEIYWPTKKQPQLNGKVWIPCVADLVKDCRFP